MDTTGGQSSLYIPEEITLNILGRLPMKARGRFRCVSKQWCLWIPRTIKLLIKKEEIKEELCYYEDCDYDNHDNFPSDISFNSMDQNMKLEELSSCPTSLKPLGKITDMGFYKYDSSKFVRNNGPYYYEKIKVEIMGSCNGLVLVKEKKDFFLWNPSTGYYGEKLHNHGVHREEYFAEDSGLCFDSFNGDYKALMAFSYRSNGTYQVDKRKLFVMVGSFKSKSWTRVDFHCDRISSVRAGPILNDCLHWLARKNNSSYQIISFDPKKDEIVDVPTPNRKRRRVRKKEYVRVYGLYVLDECLCLVCNILNLGFQVEYSRRFDILIMKEYGVKESWEILFKIEQGVDGYSELEPLFYTDDKEKVIIRTRNAGYENAIKAFDKNGNLCSDVKVLTFPDNECHTTIVYEETLAKPTW